MRVAGSATLFFSAKSKLRSTRNDDSPDLLRALAAVAFFLARRASMERRGRTAPFTKPRYRRHDAGAGAD